MSEQHPKETAQPKATTKAEAGELVDRELDDASGGMIFVCIPGMADDSVTTESHSQRTVSIANRKVVRRGA